MLDDLGQIQSRIQEIQDRISALAPAAPPPPAAPPTAAGGESAPTFATTLQRAQDSPPCGVTVPPASLGPLPPLPVSPTAPGVTPLPPVQAAGLSDYQGLIETYAAKHGIAPALVRAVIRTESGGDPKVVSRAGAMGLMQLMPANVQEAGVTDPFDPEQNIAAGTAQLAGLLQQYHGDLDLALAGYNAGPGNVRKYGGVPPFAETQNYIRKVRAAMANE